MKHGGARSGEAQLGVARHGFIIYTIYRGRAGLGNVRPSAEGQGKARFTISRLGFYEGNQTMATKKSDVTEPEDTGMTDAPDAMDIQIVTFKIVGRSPLLQNNPAEFIGNDSDESGMTVGKKKYNDEDEARLRTYKTPDGDYYHPCESFTKAMVKAASGRKFGKQFATTMLKGSVFIVEPYALIETDKGKLATKYSVDRRPVVIGKARILRCRPCWMPWQIRLALEIDKELINAENVLASLSLAGRITGIGDYRPEKGGGFGRFTAELIS